MWDEDNVEDVGAAFLALGGGAAGSKGVASGYTVIAGDSVVTVNEATTDPAVLHLPAAADWATELTIKNIGVTAVAVTPDGSDLLEGTGSVWTIPAVTGTFQEAITLKADTGSWYIISSHQAP